jgi:hypothetical protein
MIKIKTLNKLFTTNTLELFKRIKTLLTTSLTTLFLGLSSLFPYQAFSLILFVVAYSMAPLADLAQQ